MTDTPSTTGDQLRAAANEADSVLRALSGDPARRSVEGDQLRQQADQADQAGQPTGHGQAVTITEQHPDRDTADHPARVTVVSSSSGAAPLIELVGVSATSGSADLTLLTAGEAEQLANALHSAAVVAGG